MATKLPGQSTWPKNVKTLAIDIGGSGIKASVLDRDGAMITERVRVDTPYPCPPERLVAEIQQLCADLPRSQRVSVGFPGVIRGGKVLRVTALSRLTYGGPTDPGMASHWRGFPLANNLAEMFETPTKVVNDADMQGCAVVDGNGFEFVMTLGTGVGTAVFNEGALLPHMELSHGAFRKGLSVDIALGNAARKQIGKKKWRKRVLEAIQWFDAMFLYDTIYIGGGNAKHLLAETLPDNAKVVPNSAGITGGVRVWDLATESA